MPQSVEKLDALDQSIAGLLLHGQFDQQVHDSNQEAFTTRLDLHGVAPLLANASNQPEMPTDIAKAINARSVASELWEAQHIRILRDAVGALARGGLTPLIFKGSALAYSHYARPAERVRGDTDILVSETDKHTAFAALEAAGFQRALAAGGEVYSSEALFQKADLNGELHDIDLHWRLNSSSVIRAGFDYDELLSNGVPMKVLDGQGVAMCDRDALLFTCLHRAMHLAANLRVTIGNQAFPVADKFNWLKDIDLLARAMTPEELGETVSNAEEQGLVEVLVRGLRDANRIFGTELPDHILHFEPPMEVSAVTRYLVASPAQRLWMNWTATKGFRVKLSFLKDLCFPPATYMRERFSRGPNDLLALMYLRRARSGLRKLISERTG